MNIRKRKGSHKVATRYIPNSILYHIREFCKTFDLRALQGLILMLSIWAMGLVTGAIWAILIYKF